MKTNNLLIFCLTLFLISCEERERVTYSLPNSNIEEVPFIPKPNKIQVGNNAFPFDINTRINVPKGDSAYTNVSKYLAKKMSELTGINQDKLFSESTIDSRYIYFIPDSSMSQENYRLEINGDSVKVTSKNAEGAFRGIQTFRQLIPAQSVDTITEHKIWVLPGGRIDDSPNYSYRGTMLDVARHFFSVEDVKKYLDILAYYKINHFHLHLSDDQGWRIEIKKWPKLTEIGGASEVGGGPGGFYTQEDYKEIVNYAAERYITVIPEIDMPGHTNAASVAYPFLNGNGKTPEIYTGMRVGFSTFDTRKDSVYLFIDDVIKEISALTPGPYFHIGGDESHVTKKDDYLYFISKVDSIVKKYGKRTIGWDEIANADLSDVSVAQFWNSESNAQLAFEKNYGIILSPAKKLYLDMKYDENSEFGLNWAGRIPLDTAYRWSPENYLKDIPKENIMGIEAPLWSETISEIEDLEYLAFPRIIAYSELGWTKPENRNWENFKLRLAEHTEFLKSNNVNFYRSPVINWRE